MKIVAGVDEVGRGSLMGPVYAAAVILDRSINIKLLKMVDGILLMQFTDLMTLKVCMLVLLQLVELDLML